MFSQSRRLVGKVAVAVALVKVWGLRHWDFVILEFSLDPGRVTLLLIARPVILVLNEVLHP